MLVLLGSEPTCTFRVTVLQPASLLGFVIVCSTRFGLRVSFGFSSQHLSEGFQPAFLSMRVNFRRQHLHLLSRFGLATPGFGFLGCVLVLLVPNRHAVSGLRFCSLHRFWGLGVPAVSGLGLTPSWGLGYVSGLQPAFL